MLTSIWLYLSRLIRPYGEFSKYTQCHIDLAQTYSLFDILFDMGLFSVIFSRVTIPCRGRCSVYLLSQYSTTQSSIGVGVNAQVLLRHTLSHVNGGAKRNKLSYTPS